jgi:hypothetical protein
MISQKANERIDAALAQQEPDQPADAGEADSVRTPYEVLRDKIKLLAWDLDTDGGSINKAVMARYLRNALAAAIRRTGDTV